MRKAVTFGRYSVPTRAHLSTIQTILMKWDKLFLGVIDSSLERKNGVICGMEKFYTLSRIENTLLGLMWLSSQRV